MTKSHHSLGHLKECPFLSPFRLLWALRPVFLNESADHTIEEGIAQNLRGGRPRLVRKSEKFSKPIVPDNKGENRRAACSGTPWY